MSSIPKKIYQVWMNGSIPSLVEINIRKLNPNYEYFFFNEERCKQFFKDNFKDKLDVFNKINNPAHKCDLFRYCMLYKYGGVYIDIDLLVSDKLNNIIEKSDNADFITSLGAHSNENFGECTNGFILTVPGNKIFLKLIDYIVRNPNPSDYGAFVKNLYNNLNKPVPFVKFKIGEPPMKYYLFLETKYMGKYYIIDAQKRVILFSNGHGYPNDLILDHDHLN